MKTSTEIGSIAKVVGDRKAVELVGKAGFHAWDFSMFSMAKWDYKNQKLILPDHPLNTGEYLKFSRELKNIGDSYGMVCNQSHAPFPSKRMPLDFLKRAIECTAEVGGEICVIHPDNNASAEENAEFYQTLLPFAKEHGVKIATENMWNWEKDAETSSFAACATGQSFIEHIKAVNDPYFVACLDLGHAEMRGSGDGAVSMIRALGDSLQALHIHDNDCLHDSHQIPFSMSMDFEAIAAALREIEYKGYLTLEADRYMAVYTEENALEGVKRLYESVKRFDALINSKGTL